MIKDIITIIRSGGVVAAPTDTVYGLLADATNAKAIKKIYAIKGRQEDKALPIFILLEWIDDIAQVTVEQKKLLKKWWPGKVTVILPLKKSFLIAQNAISKEGTIALRMPNYSLILNLLKQYKKPLTGTSANKAGQTPCLDSKCIERQLINPTPDLIIGGALLESESSTIVNLLKKPYKILRKGADYEKVQLDLRGSN